MSKGRKAREIFKKQTEHLELTAEKDEKEIKRKEISDNLPQYKISRKIKTAARHS